MEFRVLGPLEANDGETPLQLGGPRPRALLARLLLDVNRTVAVPRLVDDLWGDEAPETAVKMVQIYVSRLRKALPADVLKTRPPGYAVEIDPDSVDLTRFARLRDKGRAALAAGDARNASALLREALSMWRGPALTEFTEPFARVEGAHLEELRLACLENRIEADVAAGRHADVIGELETLVSRHPLREPLHGQLMLALYRSGRQAEALAAYDRFRRTLDEELGIEPSEPLQRLQMRILTQDRDLAMDGEQRPAPSPPKPAPQPERPARPGIVGRIAELAQLDRALDEADMLHGGTVLISGRAGIGKTHLITELSERAWARGATVLAGRCIQLVGSGLPYLPLVDALRPLRGSPALRQTVGDLRELPRLVPELAIPGPSIEEDRDDSRLRLFEEVLTVFAQLSESTPLVVVLEDLHWADESTLDLVAFLAHAIRGRRILLVATYRSDEVREGHHLRRLASGLVGSQAAVSLQLCPLAREEVEALLTAHGARTLPPDLLATIADRAEGNPLFARELLSAASRGDTALPPALRDLLLADVARLSPEGRSLVRLAAAAGRDVPYGLLAAVMPLGELELAEALRLTVEREVLVPDQAAGTFRFRHALFADAIYETLLPGEREHLHERLARALSVNPSLAASGSVAAELAQHWAAAGRRVEALRASVQAAREAEAVSGLDEALGHVERVLELWDRVPAAEELTGVGLPSVVAWAADLAGLSVQREDEVDARLLVGILDPGEALAIVAVAERLGVDAAQAQEAMEALEREGLVERAGDGKFRAARLAVTEARRLYPSAVVLESLAVRQSPAFDAEALDGLRAANARFRGAINDAAEAIAADDDFHRRLTAGCGNDHLLAALRPVKRALLRYERVYMLDADRVERSAVQHDAIIESLARGDHAEAAQRVRENLSGGLPALTDVLE